MNSKDVYTNVKASAQPAFRKDDSTCTREPASHDTVAGPGRAILAPLCLSFPIWKWA